MDNIVHLNVHYVCVMFVNVLTYWVGALQISIIIIIIKSSGCICLQEIFSGISIRKIPDGATPEIYPLVTLPVCSFSNAKCNVIGLDLLLLVAVLSIPSSQHRIQSSMPKLFIHVSLSLVISFSHGFSHSRVFCLSLSLLCLLSPTHPCSSIYTSWSTENGSVFSPCCREPMQHTVTQSTDYLLIQSHANTITHNWPLTHTLSLHTDTCYHTTTHRDEVLSFPFLKTWCQVHGGVVKKHPGKVSAVQGLSGSLSPRPTQLPGVLSLYVDVLLQCK